jgi:hypothetical protein
VQRSQQGIPPRLSLRRDVARTLDVLPRFVTHRVDVYAVYTERRHLPARTRALDFLAARLAIEQALISGAVTCSW